MRDKAERSRGRGRRENEVSREKQKPNTDKKRNTLNDDGHKNCHSESLIE